MQTKIRIINTEWNVELKGYYREGTSDWNTLQSATAQDEYLVAKIKPNIEGIALDVGAHIGSFTLAALSYGFKKCIAIEALPENVELVNKNLQINNYEDKAFVYHRAIGPTDIESVKIYYGDISNIDGQVHQYIGSASFVEQKTNINKNTFAEVKTISLETVFKEQKIDNCSFLKIDCEGGEWKSICLAPKDILEKIDWIVGEIHEIPGEGFTRSYFLNSLKENFTDLTNAFFGNSVASVSHVVMKNKRLQ